MEFLKDALERADLLKILEIILKDLFENGIIDGAVYFSGENLEAKILNDNLRIYGNTIEDIEGIAKSFVEKAKNERKEIFEDNLVLRRGSKSSIWYKIKSIYICPVFDGEKLLGILYIDRIRSEEKFSSSEKLWLKFLSNLFNIYLSFSKDKKIIENLKKDIWIGSSKFSCDLRDKMRKYSALSHLLITGETGTGKGLLAELLHKFSGKTGDFVIVNLPSFPETLFEAELFGCRKGAYTGAIERNGLVGEANGGTLFFDEISEIPLAVQAKLLRFIETGLYKKLGEDKEIKSNCKIICATNKEIIKEVELGNFRKDLYFRISTYTIEILPLRERKEDIKDITEYHLKRSGYKISKEGMEFLLNYDFPGNVRELQNILNRAALEAKNNTIEIADLKNLFTPKKEDKIETILEKLKNGESFWKVVKDEFLKKNLNRSEVKEILRICLEKTKSGKYKELLEIFNLKEEEYHNFMSFLHKYNILEKNEEKNRKV